MMTWRALGAALAQARELVPWIVDYDARLHRREPRLRASEELLALLGPAIEQAAASAYVASGIDDPFVLTVGLGETGFPPFVRVGGEGFRRRMRR